MKKYYPYLLISPALVFIILMMLYPLIESLRLSLYQYSLTSSKFVGIENYIKLFKDSEFLQSIIITCTYTIVVVVIEFLAGLGIALLLNKPLKGVYFVRALALAPLVMTPVTVGIVWRIMYNPSLGILTYLAKLIGINILWVSEASTALPSIIIVDIWLCTGWAAILFYAGMQAIPIDQYEAAKVEGASKMQIFRMITIPWIKPMILLFFIIRTSDAFQTLDIVYSLTMGGPGGSTRTVSLFTYLRGFQAFQLGYSAAASWIIVSFSMMMSIFYFKILKAQEVI